MPSVATLPPWLLLAAVYALVAVSTNNAVAVITTPVVITLAGQLGLDPRPFVIAVMLAAGTPCDPTHLSKVIDRNSVTPC